MSVVTVRGKVERIVKRNKWTLIYIENRLTPIAFPSNADYIPRIGDIIEGKARKGRNWLFPVKGSWRTIIAERIVKPEVKPEKADYVELPIENLVLHPLLSKLNRTADETLIQNVKENGILEPILVRRGVSATFQVLAGARRLDAAKKAGLKKVPCRIIEADDSKAAFIAAWENLHRKNLDPIEEAECYKYLKDNFNLTFAQLAGKVGRTERHVRRIFNLLKLPDNVKNMVKTDTVSVKTAALLIEKLGEQNKNLIEKLTEKYINEKMSYKQLENYINKHLCYNCKSWIEPEETIFIDGMHLCPTCYDDYKAFLKAVEGSEEKEEQEAVEPAMKTPSESIVQPSQEELKQQFINEHVEKAKNTMLKIIKLLDQCDESFKVLKNEYECSECPIHDLCIKLVEKINNLCRRNET